MSSPGNDLCSLCGSGCSRGDEPFCSADRTHGPGAGSGRRWAEVILAEVGADLNAFPTHQHLASWAGMSPGNEESARKRLTGRTPKVHRWLRTALVQVAWVTTHSKNSYLAAPYRRVVGRRGKRRALVAVAHSLW